MRAAFYPLIFTVNGSFCLILLGLAASLFGVVQTIEVAVTDVIVNDSPWRETYTYAELVPNAVPVIVSVVPPFVGPYYVLSCVIVGVFDC